MIVSPNSSVLLLRMARAQFPVARLPQMTLASQVFAVTVVVVPLMQPTTGPEAFTTSGALDIPLCENISNMVRLLLSLKTITH
jgi:hypothetical protein